MSHLFYHFTTVSVFEPTQIEQMNKGGESLTVMLRQWKVLQDNLIISMKIGHCKEIRKLTFRALALRLSLRTKQVDKFFAVCYCWVLEV